MVETAVVRRQLYNNSLALQIVKLQPKAKVQTSVLGLGVDIVFPCHNKKNNTHQNLSEEVYSKSMKLLIRFWLSLGGQGPIFLYTMPSSALTQLNSTSTQTKAQVIYILKQIQPPTHPTRIVEKGDLSVNFNYQF